ASAPAFVSAIQISCRARLAFGCWLFGSLASTFAVLWTLCRRRHKVHWTKPLRGSCRVAIVGADPSYCIFERSDCDIMEALLVAALPCRKGASPMTVLRQRMTQDMQVRNLSPHTQASYLQQVS